MIYSYCMRLIRMITAVCILLVSVAALYAQDSLELRRRDTIRYGTDAEIAELVKQLSDEKTSYLDDELIQLVQQTGNSRILSGVFSYFTEREVSGLEERAIRAIEYRDTEADDTVAAAVQYLGRIRYPQALDALEDLIDAEEQRFLGASIRAYGRCASVVSESAKEDAAAFIMDFYRSRDPSDERKRELVQALGETGAPLALDFLVDIAENTEARPSMRIAAIESISKLGLQSGVSAILSGLNSTDANTRAAAIAALGPFSGPDVDTAILEAFRDSYFRTRISAAKAAGERKLGEALPFLRFRAERDTVVAVREESVRALGSIASKDAVDILSDLFRERKMNDRIRILSAEELIKLEPDSYAQLLVEELDEAKRLNQTALYNGLLKALSLAKTPGVLDITGRLLQDGGVVERAYGIEMAQNNLFYSLEEQLRELSDEKYGSLSRRAQAALEKLGFNTKD